MCRKPRAIPAPRYDRRPYGRARYATMPSIGRHGGWAGHPRGTFDALLHGDVGALQLLRDARVPHPVPGRAGGIWRAGLQHAGRRRVGLRDLHRQRVGRGDSRRPRRRSTARPVQRGARSAAPSSRSATSRWPSRRCRRSTRGLALVAARHGPAEAKRQHARRVALRAGRSTARRRVFDLLHGDQQRRPVRPDRRRLSRAAGRLARRLRRAGDRHGVRPRAVLGGPRPPAARPGSAREGSSDRTQEVAANAGGSADSRREEWTRILAIFIFFVFASLFWGAYEQAGSTLNLFADQYSSLISPRLHVPLVVAAVRAAGLRRPLRAGLRVAVATPRDDTSRRARPSSPRPAVRRPGVPAARPGRHLRAGGSRSARWWLIVAYAITESASCA